MDKRTLVAALVASIFLLSTGFVMQPAKVAAQQAFTFTLEMKSPNNQTAYCNYMMLDFRINVSSSMPLPTPSMIIAWYRIDNGTEIALNRTPEEPSYVPIVNISNLTNGVHALTLTAQLVGFLNLSQTLSPKQQLPTQHFTVENSLLIIDITSPQNKTYTQCSGISLNFTVQDPSSINSPAPPGDFSFWNKAYKPIVWTAFSLDNQTTVALNSTNAYSPYYVPISKYSLELPTLSGGNHKITISTRLNNGSLANSKTIFFSIETNQLVSPTPTPSPTPTSTSAPSPSVPEFPTLIAFPMIFAAMLTAFVLIKRKVKNAQR